MIKIWLVLDNEIIDEYIYNDWDTAMIELDLRPDEVDALVEDGILTYDWNTTLECSVGL